MILDYFENSKLSPEEWESLCDSCYSLRFPGQWHKVPAAHFGDCGIEGYIDNGIVYQCYYPEQPYANDELYEHQRDKLTKDIAKIVSPTYIAKLQSVLGRVKIKEWHLVVPEYKDRRILEHANKKELEISNLIKNNPTKYSHLDASMRITIMQADCFLEELPKVIRAKNGKIKLRVDLQEEIDYMSCDVEKVNNIKRKLRAIQPNLSDDQFGKLVNTFVRQYLDGVSKLARLRVELPAEFAELHNLLMAYKAEVELITNLNTDSSMNRQVFNEIMISFENELTKFGLFDQSTILNLKHEVISGWLADCSMEFVA